MFVRCWSVVVVDVVSETPSLSVARSFCPFNISHTYTKHKPIQSTHTQIHTHSTHKKKTQMRFGIARQARARSSRSLGALRPIVATRNRRVHTPAAAEPLQLTTNIIIRTISFHVQKSSTVWCPFKVQALARTTVRGFTQQSDATRRQDKSVAEQSEHNGGGISLLMRSSAEQEDV